MQKFLLNYRCSRYFMLWHTDDLLCTFLLVKEGNQRSGNKFVP